MVEMHKKVLQLVTGVHLVVWSVNSAEAMRGPEVKLVTRKALAWLTLTGMHKYAKNRITYPWSLSCQSILRTMSCNVSSKVMEVNF